MQKQYHTIFHRNSIGVYLNVATEKSCIGILPVKSLDERSKCFKLGSRLQVAGIEPLNLFFARFRLWRWVMLPRKSGNVPDNSLSCNSKLAKNFNLVIDGETFPENPLEPRVRDMTFPFLQVTWDQLKQGLTKWSFQSVNWPLVSLRAFKISIKASPSTSGSLDEWPKFRKMRSISHFIIRLRGQHLHKASNMSLPLVSNEDSAAILWPPFEEFKVEQEN